MLPWIVSSTPGLAAHGPVDSTFGPQNDVGPSIVGTETESHGEATECLPASLRLPLCIFPDEATDLPASPRTPPSSSPIPDFALLVTPPLCSQTPVKPLLVYSRHRFHPSRPPGRMWRMRWRMRLLSHSQPPRQWWLLRLSIPRQLLWSPSPGPRWLGVGLRLLLLHLWPPRWLTRKAHPRRPQRCFLRWLRRCPLRQPQWS